MDYFDFISEDKFRSILSRDFLELQVCLDHKASKAVLVLSGSIIEAVLLEYSAVVGVSKSLLMRFEILYQLIANFLSPTTKASDVEAVLFHIFKCFQ